jgi:hypothetical protein
VDPGGTLKVLSWWVLSRRSRDPADLPPWVREDFINLRTWSEQFELLSRELRAENEDLKRQVVRLERHLALERGEALPPSPDDDIEAGAEFMKRRFGTRPASTDDRPTQHTAGDERPF